MKKSLLVIPLFFMTTTVVKAQSLVDTNKIWKVVECLFNGDCFTYSYKFEGDTTFGTHQYKKLYTATDSMALFWHYETAMREDSSKKVYINGFSGESLYYDFNLLPGDTFLTNTNGCMVQLVVDSVDTITLLNGESRKRLFLSHISTDTWIEGIGSLFGVSHMDLYECAFDLFTELNCFSENDTLKYHSANYPSCYYTTVGINEPEKENSFSVNPNPANESIIITFSKESTIVPHELKIFDVPGKAILRENIISQNQEIDVSKFENDIYFIQLRTKNTTVIKKIIVQH